MYVDYHYRQQIMDTKDNENFLKFTELINIIQLDKSTDKNQTVLPEDNVFCKTENLKQKNNKVEEKSYPKKTKRRSMAKIKSTDLTERLNQKILEQKCVSDTSIIKQVNKNKKTTMNERKPEDKKSDWPQYSTWEQVWLMDSSKDPIINKYNEALALLEHKINKHLNDSLDDVNAALNVESFQEDSKHQPSDQSQDCDEDKSNDVRSDFNAKSSEEDVNNIFQPSINYLSLLLNTIFDKYQKYWLQDTLNNYAQIKTRDIRYPYTVHGTKKLEDEHIERVQIEFDNLVADINSNGNDHAVECTKLMVEIENSLLNHKIRGRSLLDSIPIKINTYLNPLNNFKTNDTAMEVHKKDLDDQNTSIKHSKRVKCIPTSHPDALYLQEVLTLPPKKPISLQKLVIDHENTMNHAYHLLPSIECLVDEDIFSDSGEEHTDDDTSNNQSISNNIEISTCRKRLTIEENLLAIQNQDDKAPTDSKNTELIVGDHCDSFPSRWYSSVKSLQLLNSYNVLLNGDIRVSRGDKENFHIISPEGSFSPVLLGLDSNDRPLAVKRIRARAEISKLMKDLINPLLGLRNANLLHYFTCNFENNELVVATPLCEYNMGEYVQRMKEHVNNNVRSYDVVKQFLSGLRFLHDRKEPIVHGNLKPSNIFLDVNGIVRIAEFGVHKALYTLIEAPDTSVIWFARETFKKFKESSSVICTCASDIQVAGMVIHFIFSAGKHPYGENMQDILKNLESAVPQLTLMKDVNLRDLISWMLFYDPEERPSINQVLSHVYFWSSDRRWRFILACSGLSTYGTPLDISVKELSLYISSMAAKENIKGKWKSIIEKRYPNYNYAEGVEDSIAGLLSYIRSYVQNERASYINGTDDFINYILQTFLALPLSLYRILESSQWFNHHVLKPFTTVNSLSA